MANRALDIPLTTLTVDRTSPVSLYRQLYDSLREAIISGLLAPGVRLPSSRGLAGQLGVSRNTVLGVYDQLHAEGYVHGRVGAGTYVERDLPDDFLVSRGQDAVPAPGSGMRMRLSRYAVRLQDMLGGPPTDRVSRAFVPGLPDLDHFPADIWRRLASRRWRHSSPEILGYGAPEGYRPLREAIAAYLGASRGVQCRVEQVIIVAGTQQGLGLATRVLVNPGEPVWMENPGYVGARAVLHAAGASIIPVPVDGEGLSIAGGVARSHEAVAVYVTPSHQFPLGVTMSVARRLALLEWAHEHGAWILEDDYDSEFRYVGRPIGSVQGLDAVGRVIYLGTFSKVLFPSLRLGYLIVPTDLVDTFTAAQRVQNAFPPLLDQAVLADFLFEGHFARHIRRMRGIYAERQHALLDAAKIELAGLLDLQPSPAGMHLVGWLQKGLDDRLVAQEAHRHGVHVPALSQFRLESSGDAPGLVLGYAATDVEEIGTGVGRLAAAIETVHSNSPR